MTSRWRQGEQCVAGVCLLTLVLFAQGGEKHRHFIFSLLFLFRVRQLHADVRLSDHSPFLSVHGHL